MWIYDVATQYKMAVMNGSHDNYNGTAVFNEQVTERYILEKRWNQGDRVFLAFMMNPSRASHVNSDATVKQMINLAKVYGCDALQVVNVSSFIIGSSTDVPEESFNYNPINWAFIEKALEKAYIIHISWGIKGQLGINSWVSSKSIVSKAFYNVRSKCYAYEFLLAPKEKLYYVPHPRPRGTIRKYERSLTYKLSVCELIELFGSN